MQAILLNLMAHYHSRERMPFPRTSTIAKRMGVSERTVQRIMKRLIDRGFINKEKRKRYTAQRYDITGLKMILEKFAQERIALGAAPETNDEIETPPRAVALAEAF